MLYLPNGAGEKLGDTLVTCKPLQTTGNLWYVHAPDGIDGASPAGKNREKPLLTLAQAYANATDGDIIVLMDGHAETLAALITVAKSVAIVGGGQSLGFPTVKLTAAPHAAMFLVTAVAVELRNLWISPSTAGLGPARVTVTGADFRMRGCYVPCGSSDLAAGLELQAGADRARVADTTFTSVATATASQPESGMKITGAIADLELEEVIFDGGAYGFSNVWALDGTPAAVTRLRGRQVTLKSNANARMNAGSTGFLDLSIISNGPDF